MKYVLVVCLLAAATLAYVQASLIPVQGDALVELQRDLGHYLGIVSRLRGRSYILERINSASTNSEDSLQAVVNADLRVDNILTTCDLTIRYDDDSLNNVHEMTSTCL